MKMFKELKSEVATLSQQLQELSHRLAHTEKELQAKKSQKLEGSDNNKEYLKSLSCEQVHMNRVSIIQNVCFGGDADGRGGGAC